MVQQSSIQTSVEINWYVGYREVILQLFTICLTYLTVNVGQSSVVKGYSGLAKMKEFKYDNFNKQLLGFHLELQSTLCRIDWQMWNSNFGQQRLIWFF